jgi:hypothetical protein
MSDDPVKRWQEEANNLQVRPTYSHSRTKPVIVEELKKRPLPKEKSARDKGK